MSEQNERAQRGFQGVWIPAGIWNHSELTWMEKCLVAEIDSLSSADYGPCHASCEFLAHRMKSGSPHAMREMLSQLTQKGILWQLGFDGRTVWRCVAINFTSNQSKYLEWQKDPKLSFPADFRCQPQLTAPVSHSLQLRSAHADTEIPVEIPIERRMVSKDTILGGFSSNEGKEVTKKELRIGAQLPLDSIEEGVEEAILASDRPKGMPALSAIKTEMAKHGLPVSDAEYLYDCWLQNGFKLKDGRRVQDWKAAIRVWHRNEWLPSQRKAAKAKPVDDKERVRAAIERMQANANKNRP